MIKRIYSVTDNTVYKLCPKQMTVELLKTPRGYAVHICNSNEEQTGQNLTRVQAGALFRIFCNAVFGKPYDAMFDD